MELIHEYLIIEKVSELGVAEFMNIKNNANIDQVREVELLGYKFTTLTHSVLHPQL